MSEATVKDISDNVRNMAVLVAGMSRFLIRFSSMAPFREADMGLAEWTALSIIAAKNGIENRHLANSLGVSAQRVNQITDALSKAGHILSSTSPEDKRRKILTITSSGTVQLNKLNAMLEPLVSSVLREPVTLRRACGIINKKLMPIVMPDAVKRHAALVKGEVVG